MFEDLKYAFRSLWKTPGFTLIAVLTIGVLVTGTLMQSSATWNATAGVGSTPVLVLGEPIP